MSTAGERLPYPGLRSFTREETDIFFGREGCVDEMVDRLAATRFLAVLGASGSGKSSLVKTGLLDALEIGLLQQAGSRWLIDEFRPGDRPIYNLAEGLLRASSANPAEQPPEEEIKLFRAFLARGPRSVVEWCSENLPEGTNLLLLVDQFEELFRYGAYAEREEAEAFVSLLLESARAPLGEARIYVAITMRSEFLGAAALIDGLAEAINRGLYLTPRMSREQVKDAIAGPAAVCGFEIEPALVNRLLNDLTSFAPWEDDSGHQLERLVRRADQLPLMQHVLNRLWSLAAGRPHSGPVVLKLADYEALGGLRGALAAHGREILEELLPEHREIAGAVFRALTAGSSLAEAVRRPTEFGELVEISGGDEIAVREIVEAFRAPGRNFLVPPRPAALRSDTLIDISHESLIRQWDEFAHWLQREITSADTWRRLVDAAERYKRGEANLLSGLTLASIANWWDTERPTAAWAKRYGGDFKGAADFLAESRRTEAAEKEQEAQERRQKSRSRLVTLVAVLVVLVITPLAIFAGYFAVRATQQAEVAERARAEAEQAREEAAKAERQRAAQQEAAALADRLRVEAEADEMRTRALAAQQEARQQAAAAEEQRRLAEEARRAEERALAAQKEAMQQAQRAERARADFRRATLEQLAGRVKSLQQAGSWDTSSNLLGGLWQQLIGPDAERRWNWLIAPIAETFARQSMAEFPIFPDFLNYSGYTGWTGTSGRFRVYALDRKAEDGSASTGNKTIVTYDTVSGAALGSFEIPAGQDLGSKPDLVSPDGSRVAIVTDKSEIALWAVGQPAPTLIPVPVLGGEVGVSQLAPVNSDQRFALYLTLDENPNELIVVDPTTQNISFTVTIAEIMDKLGLVSVDDVKLLGFVDDRLFMLVNKSDGQVVTVDTRGGAIGVLETGPGVSGAELTMDGAFLLTLTCPGSCVQQHLTAFDLDLNAPLWVERVPIGMALSEEAISEIVVDGKPAYSALVEQEGSGVVFQFSKDRPDVVERFDGGSHARVGSISFDAKGGFRTVESASDATSSDGLAAAGILASYSIPLSRQKLSLYVAPNSVAIYQGDDGMRVAGVSYDGGLLVYRQRADGELEDDVAFRPVPIAESNCLNSVAFGGDGKSLLFRHIDGSLLYVAAVGKGANVDWRKPDEAVSEQGSLDLSESAPALVCDRPEATENEVEEKLVPVDADGNAFALLDKTGAVWWVDVLDTSADAGEGTTAPLAQRKFAPLSRAGSGMIWIAGDPVRGRAALVSRGAAAENSKGARGAGPTAAGVEVVLRGEPERRGEAPGLDASRRQKLTHWSEPKAATFDPTGDVVVAYGDGQISAFSQGADGVFAVRFDGMAALTQIVGLFASKDRVALADDRDVVVALNSSDGALAGYARVPANPSAFALRSDGSMLSVEYDTDSVAVVDFGEPVTAAGVAEGARLVAMRSLLDDEPDTSLDSLMLDYRMEQSLAAAGEPQRVDCTVEARQRLLRLEDQLLGVSTGVATALATDCRAADGDASLDAAETLARRMPSASVRELVEEDAFSRLLYSAASGDATASRLFGAVLARIAIERGEIDTTAIAEEAMRFGANLPATMLKNVAAGAPISPTLLNLARQRSGPDPAAHQLVAHASERRINDVDSLTDALREFSIAERLYRAGGRAEEARFVAHRRAQLARLLPDESVLSVADAVERWTPEMPDVAPEGALADLPSVRAARRTFDMENANRLAERVPGSLLLETLRTEMERARIVDLRSEDPQAAADLLIDLGRRSGAASGWSPDLVREYLDLAEEIREGSAAPSALRLAAEAMRMIGAAFKAPIHDNAEASGLFMRAVDLITSTVASAPRDGVAAAMKDVDLSLLNYSYGVLPGADADAKEASQTGQDMLQATARMAEAVAANVDDPKAWNLLRGASLFWQGVLVNDRDTPSAIPILEASVEALRSAVEADPQNIEARFRLAEALRWVGLAETSSEDTAAVEREAVSEYQTIWADRATLAPGFASDVGVGYGFALANLAQTMRETNLADLSDGKTAEDHAGWVLEILALAAEKDDVNATMIETGAAGGDSTFVDGWYRMSSYGWAIGFLSGLVNVESGAGTVTQCDVAAADRYDPLRRAPGVDTVDAEAESLCRTESDGNPDDARAMFQLARAISSDSSRESEYVSIARIAAEAGVSPAFSLVASSMSGDEEDNSTEAYLAASQHTIIESFPVLYPYLAGRATTDRERQGLAWFARKAAALGVSVAHVALADSSTDPLERMFRLELAARLADEAGDTATAASLRQRAGAIPSRKADQERIEGDVSSWTPEPLVELPASSDSS